jgi:hypothetical protein
VDSLLAQVKTKGEEKSEVRKSGFGALKGMFVMSDDFKDYV